MEKVAKFLFEMSTIVIFLGSWVLLGYGLGIHKPSVCFAALAIFFAWGIGTGFDRFVNVNNHD